MEKADRCYPAFAGGDGEISTMAWACRSKALGGMVDC